MRNIKIKSSGLAMVLKGLGFTTNIVVNPIKHGYETILIAMREDALIEMNLTLKELSIFGDSKVRVRMYNIRKNKDAESTILIDNIDDRKNTARCIISAFDVVNKETNLFIQSIIKELYLSLIDVKAIKELYSTYKKLNKIHKSIDNLSW